MLISLNKISYNVSFSIHTSTFSAQLIAVGKTFCNFEDVYGSAYLQQQSLLVRFYSGGASNGFIISELAFKGKNFRLRPVQRTVGRSLVYTHIFNKPAKNNKTIMK